MGGESYVLQNKYDVSDGDLLLNLHRKKIPGFGIPFGQDINSGFRTFTTDSNGKTSISESASFNKIAMAEDYAQFYFYGKVNLMPWKKISLCGNMGISHSFTSTYMGILFQDIYRHDTIKSGFHTYEIDTVHQLAFYHTSKRLGIHISAEGLYKFKPGIFLSFGIRFGAYLPTIDQTVVTYRGLNARSFHPDLGHGWRESPLPTIHSPFNYDRPYGDIYGIMSRKIGAQSDMSIYLKPEFRFAKNYTFYLLYGINSNAQYRTGFSVKFYSGNLFGFGLSKMI